MIDGERKYQFKVLAEPHRLIRQLRAELAELARWVRYDDLGPVADENGTIEHFTRMASKLRKLLADLQHHIAPRAWSVRQQLKARADEWAVKVANERCTPTLVAGNQDLGPLEWAGDLSFDFDSDRPVIFLSEKLATLNPKQLEAVSAEVSSELYKRGTRITIGKTPDQE